MTTTLKAARFASLAHHGQLRKYTDEPYIEHPLAVAMIVENYGGTDEMIQAAILHDTVEDTDVSLEDIEREFGPAVSLFVHYVTEISQKEDGNRAFRKNMDAEHYAKGPPEAQTIKVADLIHNTASIKKHDPDFWIVYRKEKIRMLEMLVNADKKMLERAWKLV